METVFAGGLKPLEKVADMTGHHAEGILNYIFHRITNTASEGINSTIQSIKHAARGSRPSRVSAPGFSFSSANPIRPCIRLPANSRRAEIIKSSQVFL